MSILDKTIPEIKASLSQVTDQSIFENLLAQEKKGKKRKVLKRWLKEKIKDLRRNSFWAVNAEMQEEKFQKAQERRIAEIFREEERSPKDPITGIPIIG